MPPFLPNASGYLFSNSSPNTQYNIPPLLPSFLTFRYACNVVLLAKRLGGEVGLELGGNSRLTTAAVARVWIKRQLGSKNKDTVSSDVPDERRPQAQVDPEGLLFSFAERLHVHWPAARWSGKESGYIITRAGKVFGNILHEQRAPDTTFSV